MGEGDGFKLSYEKMHSEVIAEEEWIKDTKDIVELQHKKDGI